MANSEKLNFKTEVKQLLNLMINSLLLLGFIIFVYLLEKPKPTA